MSIDKIVCVGKNYLEHAKELGDEVPKNPVLFLKPGSALNQAINWDSAIHACFPDDNDVQPECEIVLKVCKDAYRITRDKAQKHISHLALGLDMTLRELQSTLKKKGHPWTTAKVFKDAAILSPWIPINDFDNYLEIDFQLQVNDKITQSAKGHDMMMKPLDILVYISQFFPLKAGDIIYTGTPAGVSSITKDAKAKLIWGKYSLNVSWY